MRNIARKLLQYLFTFVVIISMIAPSPVLAQDGVPTTPEPATTEGVSTEEVATEIAPTEVVTTAPTEAPIEATINPTEVTEVPTEVVETEIPEEVLQTEASTEVSTEVNDPATAQTDDLLSTLVPTDVVTEVPEQTLGEIIEIINDEELVISDSEGNPVALASEVAVEVLTTSDPFYWDTATNSWVGYTISGTGCPENVNCIASTTPFQTAVTNAPTGSTIYVASGNYEEDVVIDSASANLSFQAFNYITVAADSSSVLPTNIYQGFATVRSLTLDAAFNQTLGVYANSVIVEDGGYLSDAFNLVNPVNDQATITADVIMDYVTGGTIYVYDANHKSDTRYEWECGESSVEIGFDYNNHDIIYTVTLMKPENETLVGDGDSTNGTDGYYETSTFTNVNGDERRICTAWSGSGPSRTCTNWSYTGYTAEQRMEDLVLAANASETGSKWSNAKEELVFWNLLGQNYDPDGDALDFSSQQSTINTIMAPGYSTTINFDVWFLWLTGKKLWEDGSYVSYSESPYNSQLTFLKLPIPTTGCTNPEDCQECPKGTEYLNGICVDKTVHICHWDNGQQMYSTREVSVNSIYNFSNCTIKNAGHGGHEYDIIPTYDCVESRGDQDILANGCSVVFALQLEKSVVESNYSYLGDLLHYSYLVTNTSTVTVTGLNITDDKIADDSTISCGATTLAPGASTTCSVTYTISAGDMAVDNVTNTASAHATYQDITIDSLPDSVTVTKFIPDPKLSLVKTLDPADTPYDAAGDELSYSYLVKNIGNVILDGPITVSDDKVTVTCPLDTTLAIGAEISCTAVYTVQQADVNSGSVTNIAQAKASYMGSDVLSNTDTETASAVQRMSLLLDKTAAPATYDAVNDEITYSYKVTNTGNVTLTGLTLEDNRIADDSTISCPKSTLTPLESTTCTVIYKITQPDLDASLVTNTATAHMFFGAIAVDSNPDTETVQAQHTLTVLLDKTVSPDTYDQVGDSILYTYTVTNTGNTTLTGLTISDDKIVDDSTISCILTTLAPGASTTCTVTYLTTQADLDFGSVTNTATAHMFFGTIPVDSVPDDETIQAIANPSLELVKTASPATYDAVGDVIEYSYALKNTGNVTLLAPFNIADDKSTDETCPAIPTSLAPGQSITCVATYTITQSDLDAGSVKNTAQGSGFTPLQATVLSNFDDETVTAVQTKALSLIKAVLPTSFALVNDVLVYTYTVTNTGNVTLTGLNIVDDKVIDDSTISCLVNSLAPGASTTCTGNYLATLADLNAGYVTNIATAKAKFNLEDVESAQATATATARQNPVLNLDKKLTAGGYYDQVGDELSYDYTLTNNGNVTLTAPFTITDDVIASVTCPDTPTYLDPGQSIVCAATYTVTLADLDRGYVENTAIGFGSFNKALITSNPDTENAPADQDPALELIKSVTPGTYDSVGDVLSYTYLVTNKGNVTLPNNIDVDDDKVTVTCPSTPATLAPTESITCTASYTIAQADLDDGEVVNVAKAKALYDEELIYSNEDTETAEALQTPAMSIFKVETSTGPYLLGSTITYDLILTNKGNTTLDDALITDTGAVIGTCVPSNPADLAPEEDIVCSASHVVTAADIAAGPTYTNTVFGQSRIFKPLPYTVTVPLDILGCMDPTATNYNPDATLSDGSCIYPTPIISIVVPVPQAAAAIGGIGGLIPVTGARIIASGLGHSCMTANDGKVLCWGLNASGQLGNGNTTNQLVPVYVKNVVNTIDLTAGSKHTCALNSDNEVWCWGENSSGQLGNGKTVNSNIPVKVEGLTGEVLAISGGEEFTCALMKNKEVWCWGKNNLGQLNDGTTSNSSKPVKSTVEKSPIEISGGQGSLLANSMSAVGQWSKEQSELVKEVSTSLSISANRWATGGCAVTLGGEVKCWSRDLLSSKIADTLASLLVSVGLEHGCVINEDQTVSCWGANPDGELGNGTNTDSDSAVLVKNLSEVNDIAAGQHHTCVLYGVGYAAKCWGDNTYGQLGNNSTTDSNVPVMVIEPTE